MAGGLLILITLPFAFAIIQGIGDAIEEATLDPQLKARREEREKERVIIKLSYKDIMENKVQNQIKVRIGEKDYLMTKEEFEVTKQVLKENSPEKISDCCGVDVTSCNDYTARCRDCKEICGIVYVF